MRRVMSAAVVLLVLTAAGCSGFPPGSSSQRASVAPRPQASGQIDACKIMTAADVQTALGIAVNARPVSSPPGGGTGSIVGSCFYATPAQDASAGLVLLTGLPIDVVALSGGYQPVSGVGDRAYINGFTLIGQKGKTTFEIVVAMSGSQTGQAQKLTALGKVVAARL